MGNLCEIITGRATNPAALTALTMNTGDTLGIRALGDGVTPYLEGVWTQQATAGVARVRSPNLHDPAQGIRLIANAAAPLQLLPDGIEQRLLPTDVLIAEIQGGGAEVDAMALALYYANVGSGAGRFAMWEQVKAGLRNVLTVQVDVAGPATSGDWSAGTGLTNFSDQLHADTYYAVLGYTVDTASLAVAIRGPDTGNYKVGGPGPTNALETRDWFVRQSKTHGTPHIPVFNSQNKAATQVFVARVGAGGTINVSLILAELNAAP